MKKPYKFTEMSHLTCENCSKPLKMNVVARKLNEPRKCFKCHTRHERKRRAW